MPAPSAASDAGTGRPPGRPGVSPSLSDWHPSLAPRGRSREPGPSPLRWPRRLQASRRPLAPPVCSVQQEQLGLAGPEAPCSFIILEHSSLGRTCGCSPRRTPRQPHSRPHCARLRGGGGHRGISVPVRLPLWGPDIPLGGRDVLFRPGRGELSRGSRHPELDSPPPNLQPQLGSPSREGRTPTGAPPSHCLRSATWGRAPGPLPPALRTCLGCTAGPGLTGREQRGRRTPRGPNTSTPRLGSADSPSVCRPAAEGATCTGPLDPPSTCAPGGRCPTPVWHIPVTLALSGAAAAHTLITGPSSQLGPAAQASAAPSAGREDPVPPPTGAVGQSGGP